MNIPRITYYSRRHFWAWLNLVWNRVDNDRIRKVGANVACAEWLMRNGAFVKWVGHPDYLQDYNVLVSPLHKHERRLIEEIDATEATIMHIGFPYFKGCKNIKFIRLERCLNIEDKALDKLDIVKGSLNQLQVVSCGNVTDEGVKSLVKLNFVAVGTPQFVDTCVRPLPNFVSRTVLAVRAQEMINLRNLVLKDLPGVRDKEDCVEVLRQGLPECEIDF